MNIEYMTMICHIGPIDLPSIGLSECNNTDFSKD